MPEAAPTHIEAGLYYSSAENNIPGGKVKESMGSGGAGRAGEHDGLVIAVAEITDFRLSAALLVGYRSRDTKYGLAPACQRVDWTYTSRGHILIAHQRILAIFAFA